MRRALVPWLFAVSCTASMLAAVSPASGRASVREMPGHACGPGMRVIADRACTHGGDDVPKGLARVAARAPALAGSTANEMCAANGRRGRRIRAFYGYPADTGSRAAAFRPWIRASIATADANLDAQTPGSSGQHLRMYCKRDRGVTVSSIALVPIGPDRAFTFSDVMSSLLDRVELGLGDADIDAPRLTYVVFVDNIECCYGPAGQAMFYLDDRADPAANRNNQVAAGPRFALVEIGGSPATGAHVFLHEVGHTLGAVQLSAPHSSGAGHCYTSTDVMCYPDGGPYFEAGGMMQTVCPSVPIGLRPFDCEGGDYYEVDPGVGTYLASAWNTADSGWLTPPG